MAYRLTSGTSKTDRIALRRPSRTSWGRGRHGRLTRHVGDGSPRGIRAPDRIEGTDRIVGFPIVRGDVDDQLEGHARSRRPPPPRTDLAGDRAEHLEERLGSDTEIHRTRGRARASPEERREHW
jgi:hypothetical protein